MRDRFYEMVDYGLYAISNINKVNLYPIILSAIFNITYYIKLDIFNFVIVKNQNIFNNFAS